MLAIVTNTRQISELLKNVLYSSHHFSVFRQGCTVLFISILIDTLFTSLRWSGWRTIVGFLTCLKVNTGQYYLQRRAQWREFQSTIVSVNIGSCDTCKCLSVSMLWKNRSFSSKTCNYCNFGGIKMKGFRGACSRTLVCPTPNHALLGTGESGRYEDCSGGKGTFILRWCLL